MAAINMPQRPKDQLTAIAQALGIAKSVYGIVGETKQFNALEAKTAQNEQLEAQGLGVTGQAERQRDLIKAKIGTQEAQAGLAEGKLAALGELGPLNLTPEQQLAREKFEFDKVKFEADQERLASAPPKEKKHPLQTQFEAAAFATKTKNADRILSELIKKEGFDVTGTSTAIQRNSFFPELFKSEDVKKLQQSQRSFINSVLRRESGAAISPTEFTSAEAQYFPQVGDSVEVLKQKASNRQTVITALSAEGGEALRIIQAQLQTPPNAGGFGQLLAAPKKQQGGGDITDAQIDQLLLDEINREAR